MLYLKYLGIDPGYAYCGFAVLEMPIQASEITPEKIKVLDCGVLDVRKINMHVAAASLLHLAQKFKVSEILIEDFIRWEKRYKECNIKNRRASHYTVARMQRLIGYFNGYFSASSIPVSIVHPRSWKNQISLKEIELISFPPLKKSYKEHVLCAAGIVLGEIRKRIKEASGEKVQQWTPKASTPFVIP